LFWQYRNGQITTRNLDNKKHFTDKEGRVTLPITAWSKKSTIMLFSLDRKTCGLVIVEKEKNDKPFQVIAEPSVEVTGQLFDQRQEKGVPNCNGTVELSRKIFPNKIGNTNLLWSFFPETNGSGKFKIYMPAGKYQMWANGVDVKNLRRKSFDIPKEVSHHDIGRIAMEPSFIARTRGKLAPALESLSGASRQVTLEQYKGKWVLLYFWGHW